MNLSPIAVLIMLGSFLPALLGAQSAPLKVGFVNSQRLIEESAQGKAVQKMLQDEFGPRSREIEARQAELKAREEKFQRDAAVMSEAERSKSERQLRDGMRDLNRTQQKAQEDYDVRRAEELQRLQVTLVREIQAYAQAQGFDVVLSDGVLFVSPELDVTTAILKVLGEKATKSRE